jgi:hypothetical protein
MVSEQMHGGDNAQNTVPHTQHDGSVLSWPD